MLRLLKDLRRGNPCYVVKVGWPVAAFNTLTTDKRDTVLSFWTLSFQENDSGVKFNITGGEVPEQDTQGEEVWVSISVSCRKNFTKFNNKYTRSGYWWILDGMGILSRIGLSFVFVFNFVLFFFSHHTIFSVKVCV